jgi:Ethanolamine utilization protein EutJ (predicted chaperonin)
MTCRLTVLVGLCLGSLVAAQQAPVFRAGVDLVTMRVVVVDKQGQPVRGLAASDFSVRLEGQIRPVRVLNYHELQEDTVEAIEARRESTNIGQAPKSAAGTITPERLCCCLTTCRFVIPAP